LPPAAATAQEVREPAPGMFLVATKQIQDPRFQRSVVLLLTVEPAGAVGLIINRPSGMKLSSLFRDMRRAGLKEDQLYFGGPVETRKAFVLLRGRTRSRDALPILQDVAVSTSEDVIRQALRRKRAGKDYRLFMGYAGWSAGQLDQEIRRGGWYVVPADAETVFHKDEQKVWRELLRKGEEIVVWKQDTMRDRLLGRHLAYRYTDGHLHNSR
jgi:putative transcriptional regulator